MLARVDPDASLLLTAAIVVVFVSVAFIVFLTLIAKQYKRCPPNRILVIYGKSGQNRGPICVHGGARFVMPLFQHYAWLSLEPIRIEISERTVGRDQTPTEALPRVFSVAIGTTPELIETAAARLLGLTADEIRRHAEDIIVARIERLVDAIAAGETQPRTPEFYQRIESSVETELNKLGLVLLNVRNE